MSPYAHLPLSFSLILGCALPPEPHNVGATPVAALTRTPGEVAKQSATAASATPVNATAFDSSLSPATSQATPQATPPSGTQAVNQATEQSNVAARAALTTLTQWAAQRSLTLSVSVHDLESGLVLDHNAALPLNPASNMKLLTALGALHKFGASYRFPTKLCGQVRGERVETLTLQGNGDPSLEVATLFEFAADLSARGVRAVGTLNVDQSYFDEQFVPPAFEQQPNEWSPFRAPVSAVALDRNTLTLNVVPGSAGQPAQTWFEPDGAIAKQDQHGRIASVANGAANVQFGARSERGNLLVDLGGSVPEKSPRLQYSKRLDDPRGVPGRVFSKVLARFGISVERVTLTPIVSCNGLAQHQSAALAELLARLGKDSDNFYAEMLFKNLSAGSLSNGSAKAAPASHAASAAWLSAWLQQQNLLTTGSVIRNGSGLFDADRIAAETLVRVLELSHRQPEWRAEMLAQLSTSGVDGTLSRRFSQAPYLVRAKTGTLRDVVALSGYVLRQDTRPPLVFSILVNGVATLKAGPGAAREAIDAFVSALIHG